MADERPTRGVFVEDHDKLCIMLKEIVACYRKSNDNLNNIITGKSGIRIALSTSAYVTVASHAMRYALSEVSDLYKNSCGD